MILGLSAQHLVTRCPGGGMTYRKYEYREGQEPESGVVDTRGSKRRHRILGYQPSTVVTRCPGGGIGRHTRLKILRW